MIAKPWELDAKAWRRINKLPPAQREYGIATYRHFNYNSFKVPCYSAFVIYGLFLFLIITASTNKLMAWACPSFHAKLKQRLRLLRAHVLEHPLFKRKHSSVVSFPFLRWLTLQLPLRGEAIVLLLLSLINFLPLVAFYDLYVGDHNTFYPGPTSKRDQICRHLADRTAILGTAQLPLLILMASKRTPLAIVAGLGMNSLMLYHRWIARWFWLHILIHASAYTAIYVRRGGVAEMLEDTYIKWGVAGLSMMFGLVFLSLRALRQRFYEVFVMLHIAMAFFAVLGTYLHIALIKSPKFQIFVVMTEISAAVWAFDRAARFASRIYLSFFLPRLSTSNAKQGSSLIKCASGGIRAYGSNSEYTRLRISVPASRLRLTNQPKLLGGIAGGDDIRITIPRLQWVGEHPFTVFAVGTQPEDPTRGYIDLLIKTEAGLTRKLARHISKQRTQEGEPKDVELAGNDGKESKVAVMIEGPFGIIPDIHSATDLVLVSGGIAITFCWPLFVAAVRASANSVLRSCTLKLVEEAFTELIEEMEAQQGRKGCRFSMDIYVTSHTHTTSSQTSSGIGTGSVNSGPFSPCSRSSSSNSIKEKLPAESSQAGGSPTFSSELTNSSLELPILSRQSQTLPDNRAEENLFSDRKNGDLVKVTQFIGRPEVLSSALFGHLEEGASQEERCLTVGLCGPPSLCDDVRVETIKLLKKGVHVELLEDCFTW
ncbi:related to FRE4 - Ferric reductase [Ustilago trichophora]|uniref:Related to FRE4 - Ferric reductase n=1 Tax=Ustilago trichophora TaxID=86804 RepID=A0A5C3E3D6_9BASI|nr:related to FRE4 - Ferric reductase [Ustilago trichophora]